MFVVFLSASVYSQADSTWHKANDWLYYKITFDESEWEWEIKFFSEPADTNKYRRVMSVKYHGYTLLKVRDEKQLNYPSDRFSSDNEIGYEGKYEPVENWPLVRLSFLGSVKYKYNKGTALWPLYSIVQEKLQEYFGEFQVPMVIYWHDFSVPVPVYDDTTKTLPYRHRR
ncbi:MAG: hypothetical protein ACPGO5_04660 [Patescibacteria group bacterium]